MANYLPYVYGMLGGPQFSFKHVILVAQARVFYHCHYIGDTFVGTITGFTVAAILRNLQVQTYCQSASESIINLF